MKLNYKFHYWFIGFLEGNRSFSVNSNSNKCYLVINQKNIKVLTYIRDNLKTGSIKKYNTYYQWIVTSKKDIYKVLSYLNGYLTTLPGFINNYNKYYKLEVEDPYYVIYKAPIKVENILNEENSWLSGFLDAKGSFNIRIVSFNKKKRELLDLLEEFDNIDKDNIIKKKSLNQISSYIVSKQLKKSMSLRIRLRLLIRQKESMETLEKLQRLLGGSIRELNKTPKEFEYCLDSNKRQKEIINYINKNPLRSLKHIDYLKFKIIYERLNNNEHLNISNPIKVINWLKKYKR